MCVKCGRRSACSFGDPNMRIPWVCAQIPLTVAILVLGLSFSLTAFAQPSTVHSAQPMNAPTPPDRATQIRQAWVVTMSRTPLPKKGCFKSSFPSTQWQEVPCSTAPPNPYLPATGTPLAQQVGNGNDYSAQTSGSLSSVQGSLGSVGLYAESGNVNGKPPPVANSFALQLNTNRFRSVDARGNVIAPTPCKGGAAGCLGWQQFIYSNSGQVFIQYWLLGYGPTCPSGWNQTSLSPNNCFANSSATSFPVVQNIADLAFLVLTGSVAGSTDTVTIAAPAGFISAASAPSILGLQGQWKTAEFNVFGDCCGSQANFSKGTLLTLQMKLNDGTTIAPSCAKIGFTGETNNLGGISCSASSAGYPPSVGIGEDNGDFGVAPIQGGGLGDGGTGPGRPNPPSHGIPKCGEGGPCRNE